MPRVADLVCLTGLCGCVWLSDYAIMLMSCFPDAGTSCLVGLESNEVPTSTLHYSGSARVCSRFFFFCFSFPFRFSAKIHASVILGKSCQGIYCITICRYHIMLGH